MNRTTRWSVVVLLAGFTAWFSGTGCEDAASNTKPLVLAPVPFSTLQFEKAWTWRQHAPAHYVIRNESQWQRMWRRAHIPMRLDEQPPPPPAAPVDFKSEMILAAFQGRYPTGGYRIQISEVGETNHQMTVVVKYREPGPQELVTHAVTYPAHLVRVPKSDKPVGFRIVEVGGSR